jgi:ankyrin repeat protein
MNTIDEELIMAAKENNVPEVSRLLNVGANANAKGRSVGTPLHWASLHNRVAVVKELLDHGADTEATDLHGTTPLHIACLRGHVAVVNELLSPNDSNGSTTTSILGKRKSRGADTEAKGNTGSTPLHLACCYGHLPVVKALLSGGANVLAANNQGTRPIHFAVNRGHSEVTKYLLQHHYATCPHLPLHELLEDLMCIVNPNSEILDVPPVRYALHQGVLVTDDVVEILEFLEGQSPALLSTRDQDGSLSIHVACRRGASFSIVQSLVNLYKASVKSVTPQGDLPLFLACEMPDSSLDSIFLLMKLYPDLVYERQNSGLRRSGRDRRAPVPFS